MTTTEIVAKAVSESLSLDGAWDTQRLALALIDGGLAGWKDEATVERSVIRAMDAVGWGEAHDSVIVASILLELGFPVPA